MLRPAGLAARHAFGLHDAHQTLQLGLHGSQRPIGRTGHTDAGVVLQLLAQRGGLARRFAAQHVFAPVLDEALIGQRLRLLCAGGAAGRVAGKAAFVNVPALAVSLGFLLALLLGALAGFDFALLGGHDAVSCTFSGAGRLVVGVGCLLATGRCLLAVDAQIANGLVNQAGALAQGIGLPEFGLGELDRGVQLRFLEGGEGAARGQFGARGLRHFNGALGLGAHDFSLGAGELNIDTQLLDARLPGGFFVAHEAGQFHTLPGQVFLCLQQAHAGACVGQPCREAGLRGCKGGLGGLRFFAFGAGAVARSGSLGAGAVGVDLFFLDQRLQLLQFLAALIRQIPLGGQQLLLAAQLSAQRKQLALTLQGQALDGIGLLQRGLAYGLPQQGFVALQARLGNGSLPARLGGGNFLVGQRDLRLHLCIDLGIGGRQGGVAGAALSRLLGRLLHRLALLLRGQGGAGGLVAHCGHVAAQGVVVLGGGQQLLAAFGFNVGKRLLEAAEVQRGHSAHERAQALARRHQGIAEQGNGCLRHFGTAFERIQPAGLADAVGHVGKGVFDAGDFLRERLRSRRAAVNLA